MKDTENKKKIKKKVLKDKNKCKHKKVGNSWGWYVCEECGEIW